MKNIFSTFFPQLPAFVVSFSLLSTSLHGAGEAELEQDRKAILAMAGEFLVDFSFYETMAFQPEYKLRKPYLENATEKAYVLVNEPQRIVLQHILFVEETDEIVKHWKQEWIYQDQKISEFVGDQTWVVNHLPEEKVAGTWSQRVYQVDDTPRYESYGKWIHEGEMSSWTSQLTRRPLPRREQSKRDDYKVLMAVNRHTITPTGWFHEQDNYKQVAEGGKILCREVGLNRYERTADVDFAKADEYWSKTSSFWIKVTEKWNEKLDTGRLQIRPDKEVNGPRLFSQLFDLAKAIGDGKVEDSDEKVSEIVEKFTVVSSQS